MGCAVWKRGVHRWCWRSTEQRSRGPTVGWGVPMGLRSAHTTGGAPEVGYAERHPVEVHESRWRSTNGDWVVQSQQKRAKQRGGYGVQDAMWEWQSRPRSSSGNWGAPIRSLGARNGGYRAQIEIQVAQSRLRSANQDWAASILGELCHRGVSSCPLMCNWWVEWHLV